MRSITRAYSQSWEKEKCVTMVVFNGGLSMAYAISCSVFWGYRWALCILYVLASA